MRKKPSKQEENDRGDKDTDKFQSDIHAHLRFSLNTEMPAPLYIWDKAPEPLSVPLYLCV